MKSRRGILTVLVGAVAVCAVVGAVGGLAAFLYVRRALRPVEWGPDYATPNVTLEMVELNADAPSRSSRVRYALVITGLPAGHDYALWQLPFGKHTPVQIDAVEVNEAGEVSMTSSGQTYTDVLASDYARGAALRIAILSEDQAIRAYASDIPFPIEATGDGGCRLSIELLDAQGQGFRITAEGFEPNEVVSTVSRSESERIEGQETADETGIFSLALFPAVLGKTSGDAEYSATGQNCSVTVPYKWGPAALATE